MTSHANDPVHTAHAFVYPNVPVRPPAGHPGSLWLSAATVLQVDNGNSWVTPVSAVSGQVPDVVVDYGAVGDGSTDDRAVIQQALDENRRVRLPAGNSFRLSAPLEIEAGVHILEGDSGVNSTGASLLVPDAGQHGIIVHHANTSGGNGDGSWSTLRDFAIVPAGKSGTAHGILALGRCYIERVGVASCSGHGIFVDGTSSSGGNANAWSISHCRVTACDGDGIFVDGTDANAGCGFMVDSTGNTGWGINDDSFLGNTWIACHVRDNDGGAYRTNGSSNKTVLLGCYSESGEPASALAPQTLVLGGEHGAGFTDFAHGNIGHATGQLKINSTTIEQSNNGFGTYMQSQLTASEMRFMLRTSTVSEGSALRLYQGDSNFGLVDGNEVRIRSGNGTLFSIKVSDGGVVSATTVS